MPEAELPDRRSRVYSVPFGGDFCDATATFVPNPPGHDPMAVSQHLNLFPKMNGKDFF